MTEYDAAPVGLWKIDPENGKVIHANKAALSILGCSDFSELSRFIDEHQPNLIEELKHHNSFNLFIQNKNGDDLWIGGQWETTAEGLMEGTIYDVTSQKNQIENVSMLKEKIILKLKQFDSCQNKTVKIA